MTVSQSQMVLQRFHTQHIYLQAPSAKYKILSWHRAELLRHHNANMAPQTVILVLEVCDDTEASFLSDCIESAGFVISEEKENTLQTDWIDRKNAYPMPPLKQNCI